MTAARRPLSIALLLLLQAAAPDPLAAYYTNTLVCIGSHGEDLCHLWLAPDGSFMLFGGSPSARAGRYTRAATPDGKTQLCLTTQTAGVALPPELAGTSPPPDRFAATPCVALTPHAPGDRWADPASPNTAFLLVPGQQ